MVETAVAPAPSAPVITDVALRVRNLNFYYGKFQGLKNINLDIAKHKCTAFIGPSGCGKSTLLRVLNRMYDLYPGQRAEGQLLLNGVDVLGADQDLNLLRAKVGMVFQKPTPFPMSIYENIAFGVRLYESLSRPDMDNRIEWALRRAALWDEVKDKLDKSGLSLSGDSSNVCALPVGSRLNRKSCCWMNRPQRSIRFRLRASKNWWSN